MVKATVGIHPDDGQEIQKTDFAHTIATLEEQYLTNPDLVCAIGECGIDLHYKEDTSLLPHQQQLFHLQCRLAQKYQLPLVVHSRDAFEPTKEVLQEFKDLKIYFHCWGYGSAEITQAEKAFPQLRIGFTNILTYKNAETTREALRTIQHAKILTETDAPRLPPQAFRGKTCYPKYVREVLAKMAEVLAISSERLEKEI